MTSQHTGPVRTQGLTGPVSLVAQEYGKERMAKASTKKTRRRFSILFSGEMPENCDLHSRRRHRRGGRGRCGSRGNGGGRCHRGNHRRWQRSNRTGSGHAHVDLLLSGQLTRKREGRRRWDVLRRMFQVPSGGEGQARPGHIRLAPGRRRQDEAQADQSAARPLASRFHVIHSLF